MYIYARTHTQTHTHTHAYICHMSVRVLVPAVKA